MTPEAGIIHRSFRGASAAREPGIADLDSGSGANAPSRNDGSAMTPEEMLARLLYRDGLMLVIDKPAGIAVHRGPKGGAALDGYFDALALRPAAQSGAGASARPRHLRLPGARPPSQGAGAARQAVQAGQGRQDLLGGGRRLARRRRGPHRYSARQARRRARLVDETRSARRAGGEHLEGDGARLSVVPGPRSGERVTRAKRRR